MSDRRQTPPHQRVWMLPQTVNPIMDVLGRYPSGVTAKRVAAELNWKETAASLRLGRLATAGVIAREVPPERRNNLFLYRLKEQRA